MIRPDTRSTLTEALVPPPGYEFDAGLATTYSLDLGTLITLPLQLAWLATGDDTEAQRDPIRLLEGLRRVSSRLTVYSDVGHIHIPRMPHALMGLMEEMIYEVRAPHGGTFHPKVWALRFKPDDSRKKPLLRLLVLSRNISDDRSWDLSLCLEGSPLGGIHAANSDLAAFVRRLPTLSAKPISALRHADILALAEDIHRCQWELPGAFEQVGFHVLGMGSKPRPFRLPSSEEAVVISPFVSDAAIRHVASQTKNMIALVSRAEELALLQPKTRAMFGRVDVVSEEADFGAEEELGKGALRGLHAKVIVLRQAWETHVFTGSANCTSQALLAGTNVEVMAELVGRHSKVGLPVDWVSEKGMGPLLVQYADQEPSEPQGPNESDLVLEQARKQLTKCELKLRCLPKDGDYSLQLCCEGGLDAVGAEVMAWPLTVPSERKTALLPAGAETFGLGRYAAQDITSLTGFTLRIGADEISFGMELPLENPPIDREAGVLALILRNRAAFLRYLSLLLGEAQDFEAAVLDGRAGAGWFGDGRLGDDTPPVFELLLKAYARTPEKLDVLASAVARLRRVESDSGEQLLPPEFLQIWRTFEEAKARGPAK